MVKEFVLSPRAIQQKINKMDTNQERKQIEEALASSFPTKAINQACRTILLARIERENFLNSKLKRVVENIIKTSEFDVDYVLKEYEIPTHKQNNPLSNIGFLAAIGVAGFGAILTSNILLKLVGCGLMGAAGYGFGLIHNKPIPIIDKKMSIVTTTDGVIKKLDVFYNAIRQLLDANKMLKTSNESVLKSLQQLLKLKIVDENVIRDYLEEVISDHYNVKLVDCEGDYANTDYFEFYESVKIENPATTLKAMVSIIDDFCISKGVHVIPKK